MTKDFGTFLQHVKHFCFYLETPPTGHDKGFLSAIQNQLIQLYTFGQTLTKFDFSISRDLEEVEKTDKDLQHILPLIYKKLNDTYYWVVFDPKNHNDTEPVCGDLADDLGDIYKDLKTFIIAFENDDEKARQNALFDLKWSFENHWNDHCINAIYAIHYFLKHEN
jgi:hypothetical protein